MEERTLAVFPVMNVLQAVVMAGKKVIKNRNNPDSTLTEAAGWKAD